MPVIFLRRPTSGSHFRTVPPGQPGPRQGHSATQRTTKWASCNGPRGPKWIVTYYGMKFEQGQKFPTILPLKPSRPAFFKPSKPCR